MLESKLKVGLTISSLITSVIDRTPGNQWAHCAPHRYHCVHFTSRWIANLSAIVIMVKMHMSFQLKLC